MLLLVLSGLIFNTFVTGTSTLMFEDTVGRDLASDIYFKRPDTPPEQRK